jgi:putative FmdB family regulatory protein
MPLYEYVCSSCGHRFERIQKFSDPPVTTCPDCGGPVEKQISSPAIQFKGSGWYVNDYAKAGKSDKGTGKAAKGDEAATGSDASKADTSSKTEAKAEPAKSDTPAAKPASSDK